MKKRDFNIVYFGSGLNWSLAKSTGGCYLFEFALWRLDLSRSFGDLGMTLASELVGAEGGRVRCAESAALKIEKVFILTFAMSQRRRKRAGAHIVAAQSSFLAPTPLRAPNR